MNSVGGERTHSFTEYLYSQKILLGAELEKVLVICITGIILAFAVNRYRRNFIESVNTLHKILGELKSRNQDLTKSKENLEHANQIKSHFLTLVSHELRTPINGILGSASLMSQEEESEDKKEYEQDIIRSVFSLKNTVDGMLSFLEYESKDSPSARGIQSGGGNR